MFQGTLYTLMAWCTRIVALLTTQLSTNHIKFNVIAISFTNR